MSALQSHYDIDARDLPPSVEERIEQVVRMVHPLLSGACCQVREFKRPATRHAARSAT